MYIVSDRLFIAAADGSLLVLLVCKLKKVDAGVFPGMDLWERDGQEECLVLDDDIRSKIQPLVVVYFKENLYSVLY